MRNREIKFRAWDGKSLHNDWMNVTYNKPSECAGIKIPHRYSPSFSMITALEVMQYTGLKDKNGKEIYEGDIVSYGLDEHPCVIEFKYACFYISSTDNIDHHLGYYRVYNLEVVGNIYENPDLIGE